MWANEMDGVLLDLRQKCVRQDIVKQEPHDDCDDPEDGSQHIWPLTSNHSLGLENSSSQRLPLNCPDCGKSFSHSSSLKRHSRTHTGVRPFICGICNKGFHYKNNLQDHARTHTGEKPYKCPDCGQSFAQSSTLNRHIGTHGKDKVCKICGKAFVKLSLLQKHLSSHRGKEERPTTLNAKSLKEDQCPSISTINKAVTLKNIQNLCCVKCGLQFDKAADLQHHFWSHMREGQSLFYELAALNGLLNMLELIKQGSSESGDVNKP